MFRLFSLFKRKISPDITSRSEAAQYLSSLIGFIDIMNTTLCPAEFFASHKRAIDLCELIFDMNSDSETLVTITRIFSELTEQYDDIVISFFNRSEKMGMLTNIIDDMISYRSEISDKCYNYFCEITGINNEVYTYCSVVFDSDKQYHYICDFEGVALNDIVVVPVGDDMTEKLATVVDVASYRYDTAPYPVKKTKHVISKIG